MGRIVVSHVAQTGSHILFLEFDEPMVVDSHVSLIARLQRIILDVRRCIASSPTHQPEAK